MTTNATAMVESHAAFVELAIVVVMVLDCFGSLVGCAVYVNKINVRVTTRENGINGGNKKIGGRERYEPAECKTLTKCGQHPATTKVDFPRPFEVDIF